jgi:hypothetical protein
MVKRIIPLLMTGYALWRWNQRRQQRARTEQQANSVAKPAAVSRWEGEGGALRDSPRAPSA